MGFNSAFKGLIRNFYDILSITIKISPILFLLHPLQIVILTI